MNGIVGRFAPLTCSVIMGCASADPPAQTTFEVGGIDAFGSTSEGADESTDDGSETRLDVGTAREEGCLYVDLLFVIDNSGSMCAAQQGLSAELPGLVDAMFDTLPPATDIHVGLTTTSFSHGGSHSETGCRALEADSVVADAFVTDDVADYNGYQGRLFEYDGQRYFEANTSDHSSRDALETWFSEAVVAIGCNGGAFDFSSAAAAYALHPVNAATNEDFLRDEGAALGIFVLTDETDHSPEGITYYRDIIRDAKAGCGGDDCIVTAGLLAPNCVPDWDPQIWQFLTSFTQQPQWGDIDDPNAYATVVRDALSTTIAQTCDSIDPVG